MPTTAVCPGDIMNKIGVPLDRIHPVAVLVGDPSWIQMLSALATTAKPLSQYKSMHSWEMEYNGQTFFVISHGYGGTNMSRVITELGIFGVRCVIMIADSVSLVPGRVARKELCITYASCRGESSSAMEVDVTYPAVAHPDATRALRQSAKDHGLPVRLTRSLTSDKAYQGKIKRKNELLEEVLQTDVELQDRNVSLFLTACSIRKLVAGVVSCNETEPTKFHPETGKPIEDQDVLDARSNAMRIALGAAAKLVVQYDYDNQDSVKH